MRADLRRWMFASVTIAALIGTNLTGAAERDRGNVLSKFVAQECSGDRLSTADPSCVGALAEKMIRTIELRIVGMTRSPRNAFKTELSQPDVELLRSHLQWRSDMEADCQARSLSRGAMPAARQICRLNEALKRLQVISQYLSKQLEGNEMNPLPVGTIEVTFPVRDAVLGTQTTDLSPAKSPGSESWTESSRNAPSETP